LIAARLLVREQHNNGLFTKPFLHDRQKFVAELPYNRITKA
jgi:hypothetical protein